MSEVAHREKQWWEHYPYHRIWCNDFCPLVPRFSYRKGDEWNANNWSFRWLFFTFWTMEHFSFGLDCGLDTNRIYVGAILPYFRIMISIENHYHEITYKLNELTYRKPAIKRKNDEC